MASSYVDQLFSHGILAMMGVHVCPTVFLIFLQFVQISQAREFCQAEGYWCDTGHCCGSGECCTYYYELWWFWLVWFLIVFIIGFCVWQRKRFHPWRDNRCERTCSIQDMFLGRGFNFADITPVPPCKLPSYSEIGETVSYDTPPPPYNVESALPAFVGEGPSTSLPAGDRSHHCPPPHRGLQAITQSLSSLNSTPSPSDAPPSYSQIIGNHPNLASIPCTPILPQHRLSMGTQFPEQGLHQLSASTSEQQQQQQQQQRPQQRPQQNENNSGSNSASSTPSTPGRPTAPSSSSSLSTSTVVHHHQAQGIVATCACGSPLRTPLIAPRMLPPPVPSSPKTTVVSLTQRPQRFLSPHGSPHRFTTSVITSTSQPSAQNERSPRTDRHSPASTAGRSSPRPGAAVRTSPGSGNSESDGAISTNGHTVVDMTNSRPVRRSSFLSWWHQR